MLLVNRVIKDSKATSLYLKLLSTNRKFTPPFPAFKYCILTMESNTQVHKEEEKKSSRARYDHLRSIEKEVQEKYNLEESFYAAPKAGYEK